MRTSSAKSKGRRACQEARDMLLEAGKVHGLVEDDIRITSSGAFGEDLLLSPKARERFNFTFELKNQEKLRIWESCEQAEGHAEGTDRIPLLVFRRNKGKLRVVLDFQAFLKLINHG